MNAFIRICAIKLERDSKGMIVDESPISKKNPCEQDLVPYCKFQMSSTPLIGGVFLIKVDDEIKYVGGTENLNRYLYGGCNREHVTGVSKNQGWPSECRLKKGIPKQVKTGEMVEVWFLRMDNTSQRRIITLKLNKKLKSEWNRRW